MPRRRSQDLCRIYSVCKDSFQSVIHRHVVQFPIRSSIASWNVVLARQQPKQCSRSLKVRLAPNSVGDGACRGHSPKGTTTQGKPRQTWSAQDSCCRPCDVQRTARTVIAPKSSVKSTDFTTEAGSNRSASTRERPRRRLSLRRRLGAFCVCLSIVVQALASFAGLPAVLAAFDESLLAALP